MKYIIPCMLALLIVLIFFPNDYDDEIDTTIYMESNKYYTARGQGNISAAHEVVSGAIAGSGSSSLNYGVTDTEWIMPVNTEDVFYITSLIGYRVMGGEPKYHRGFDISNGKSGSPILSIGDGSVVDIKSNPNNSSGFGICITIRYNSSLIGNFCTIYAHMSALDKSLKIGSIVRKGQQIGQIGNTGNSKGPHLHWQNFYGSTYSDLNNSFNPFQVLFPVENKAKAISDKYGLKFYEPGWYSAENAFYSMYALDKNKYSAYYNENKSLGMLLDDGNFF